MNNPNYLNNYEKKVSVLNNTCKKCSCTIPQLDHVIISITASELFSIPADSEYIPVNLYIDGQYRDCEIRPRGNSTRFQNKKGYNIRFKTETELYGMGFSTHWALLGEYFDHSYIRNQLVYQVGNNTNIPSPPFKNLVLDTTELLGPFYYGLYSLTKKFTTKNLIPGIEVDAIITFDRPTNNDNLLESQGDCKTVPSIDDHSDKYSKREIREKYANLYLSVPIADPNTLEDIVDFDTFSTYFLISEIFSSGDAYLYSAYTYCINGKIYAGYLWDYNFSCGDILDVYENFNSHSPHWSCRSTQNFDLWRYYRNNKYACSSTDLDPTNPKNYIDDPKMYIAKTQTIPNTGIRFALDCVKKNTMSMWYINLLRSEKFRTQVVSKYWQFRKNIFSEKYIFGLIDSFAHDISGTEGAPKDIIMWFDSTLTTNYTTVNNPNKDYETSLAFFRENVDLLKKWLYYRLQWLDQNMGDFPTDTENIDNWENYWEICNCSNFLYKNASAPRKK